MVLEHLLAAVRLTAAEMTDVRRLLETYHGRLSDLMGRVEPILLDHYAEAQARQAARHAQEAEILAQSAGEETRIKRAQKIAQAEKDLKAAKFRATAWRLGELLLAAGVSAVATWLGLAHE